MVWTDGWDGYPLARQRLIDALARRENANPIILGGDTHCYWVTDVKADYADMNSATVASEFVTTAVTSQRGGYESTAAFLPNNPHIKHFDTREQGYGLIRLSRERAEVDLRVVGDVSRRDGYAPRNQKQYVVEAGQPGAVEV
jgi:alkaline phosphatase D